MEKTEIERIDDLKSIHELAENIKVLIGREYSLVHESKEYNKDELGDETIVVIIKIKRQYQYGPIK